MTRFLFFSSFVLCTLLAGCDDAEIMKQYAPLQDEPVARKYLDLLITAVQSVDHFSVSAFRSAHVSK